MFINKEDPCAVEYLVGFYKKPTQGALDPPDKKRYVNFFVWRKLWSH